MNKLKNILLKKIEKEDIIPILITGVFILGMYFLGNNFLGIMWIIIVILLVVIMSLISLFAGFSVMKSLFEVAAGLSLLIFLAQSYCVTPYRNVSGNNALGSLFTVGIIYIIINFYTILRKEIKNNYKKIENKNEKKDKIIISTLFLMFVGLFIWEIFLVVNPIVMNLCIYK